ncbi:RRXRR domain-containing protein [Enterocloster clostridioformis]|nr:RRXRR domain-containing protein [Enterocloster clostridioformis]QQR00433.1 RRXRR domain-containing protein [Enterocloster clostridioformis]
MKVRIQEHIIVIKRVCKILLVRKVIMETAEFDIQMLKRWRTGSHRQRGYGDKYGFYNTR